MYEDQKKYYLKNREKIIEKQKEYYQKNKEKILKNLSIQHKKIDYKNKMDLKEYNRLYYLNRNLGKKKKSNRKPKENNNHEPLFIISNDKFIIEL